MSSDYRRMFTLLVVAIMLAVSCMPSMGSMPSDGYDAGRGPGPMDASEVWTDSFDDMSNVYVPGAGLVGVEVVGGEARLKAGEMDGWIASSITATGYSATWTITSATASKPG